MTLLLILSRAVHFCSCLLLLGFIAVRLLLGSPASTDIGASRRLSRLCLVCLFAAAGSGFLWLWEAIAGMSGSGLLESLSPALFHMVLTQTAPGQIWAIRGCIIAALLPLLFCSRLLWTWIVDAVLAAGLVASLAWLGHAGAGEDRRRAFMLTADVFQLLAAGVWPGGLLPFALCLKRQLRADSFKTAHSAVRRFSAINLVTVAALAASGVVNAYSLVGSFHALVSTDYGRLLCIKLALFTMAVSLGAVNLLVHKPHFEAEPGARMGLARNVWTEVALGILIVLVVAIMGTMPPALAR
jgi:copper resistance protein D